MTTSFNTVKFGNSVKVLRKTLDNTERNIRAMDVPSNDAAIALYRARLDYILEYQKILKTQLPEAGRILQDKSLDPDTRTDKIQTLYAKWADGLESRGEKITIAVDLFNAEYDLELVD